MKTPEWLSRLVSKPSQKTEQVVAPITDEERIFREGYAREVEEQFSLKKSHYGGDVSFGGGETSENQEAEMRALTLLEKLTGLTEDDEISSASGDTRDGALRRVSVYETTDGDIVTLEFVMGGHGDHNRKDFMLRYPASLKPKVEKLLEDPTTFEDRYSRFRS